MKSNLDELPNLVRLAAKLGLEEVKVVYLTVFDDTLLNESLWDEREWTQKIFEETERLGDELGVAVKLPHLIGEDVAEEKLHKDCFVTWRDFFLGSDGFVRPCMSTNVKFFHYDKDVDFMELWNHPEFQAYRAGVNDANRMDASCRRCYQSSHCNWNRRESFIQTGEAFSPEWEKV